MGTRCELGFAWGELDHHVVHRTKKQKSGVYASRRTQEGEGAQEGVGAHDCKNIFKVGRLGNGVAPCGEVPM